MLASGLSPRLLMVWLALATSAPASAQLIYDADTEALAAKALEAYRKADLGGAFAAARTNLDALYRLSMASTLAGAEFQGLIAVRAVVDPGENGSPYSPDLVVLEPTTGVFSAYQCEDFHPTERPLREFVQCKSGFVSATQLDAAIVQMQDALAAIEDEAASAARSAAKAPDIAATPAAVSPSPQLRLPFAVPPADAIKKDREKAAAPLVAGVQGLLARTMPSAARAPVRSVEIFPDAGALAPREAVLRAFALNSKRAMADEPIVVDCSAMLLAGDTGAAFDVVRAAGTAASGESADDRANAALALFGLSGVEAGEARVIDEAPALLRRFQTAMICAAVKSRAIAGQKAARERDRRRYAMINLCLTRVAGGKYNQARRAALENAAGADPTGDDAAAARDAASKLYRIASRCAADALGDYLKHLSGADADEVASAAFQGLMIKLFTDADNVDPENGAPLPEPRCKALLGDCTGVPVGSNPLADAGFRDAWVTKIDDWGGEIERFDVMEAALKAIGAANSREVAEGEAPARDLGDIADWIKKFAETLDNRLEEAASAANDLGVQLAAVEAQFDAVSFILGAAAAGAAPELDPARACAALADPDKTECVVRLQKLSPRVKAAAAIAGTAPGLLQSMQALIDQTAEPPPLSLVIARNQLAVRAGALAKRLAVLEAERQTWMEVARNELHVARMTDEVLDSFDDLCAKFGRRRPPVGESCAPATLSHQYKSKTAGALSDDQRKAVLDAGARYAQLFWLDSYGESAAFNKLVTLGYENQLLIDEETVGLAAASIDAMLVEIDFRGKRGLKAETVADFTSRLVNLGLLTAIAIDRQ
jgi:hypothetical protein